MRTNFLSKLFILFLFLPAGLTLRGQELSTLKDQKPFAINGSLGLSSSFYTVSGIPERQSPFSYGINANATLSVYGISMPFSFTWYNHSKKGNFYQPFNQFGISPSYKWLKVHLGYRNLSFSEFTLNGYTFLGAGVEATPGKFRIGAVYGKFNQNSTYNMAMVDSLPKLTRTGWAVKLGYGTAKRFVDLSVLRIGDNPNLYNAAAAQPGQPTPEQNIAFGLTSNFEITPKLLFTFDGSYSFYTKDRTMEAADSLTNNMLRFADNFITVNNSSQYFKAFKTSLSYKFTPTVISKLEYRRIDPGFRSMGSYFFNNDIEHITFNQSLALLQNKLMLRGSLGLQRDNLKKQKEQSSTRMIGSLSANWNIDQHWGVDAFFNNYSNSQRAYRQSLTDTIRVFHVNRTISLMPRFMKAGEKMSHMVMLNLSLTSLDERNKQSSDMVDTDTYTAMLMYNLGHIPFRANLSSALNYIAMRNSSMNMQMYGGNLNISKTLLEDNLSITLGNNLMYNDMDENSSLIWNMSLNASYRFRQKHSIALNFNAISNRFKNPVNPSYHETRGEFSYVFTF